MNTQLAEQQTEHALPMHEALVLVQAAFEADIEQNNVMVAKKDETDIETRLREIGITEIYSANHYLCPKVMQIPSRCMTDKQIVTLYLNDDGTTCTSLNEIMKKPYMESKLGFTSVFFVPSNIEVDYFPHKLSEYPGGRQPSSRSYGMSVATFDPDYKGTPIDDIVFSNELRELGQLILDNQKVAA
jgi:hypothetical protein